MAQFVLDNSVTMTWCFEDESNPYADSILDLLNIDSALVPPTWPLEVVNVLLVAERRKRLSKAASSRFINLLEKLPIIVVEDRPENMMHGLLALASTNNLSSYDASYLALAIKYGLPIATLDGRLLEAAKTVGIQILAI